MAVKVKGIELPREIKAIDLKYPSYKSKDKHVYDQDFELLHTQRFGWVIPTLFIGRSRSSVSRGFHDRTYAVCVNGNGICRVGKGPHIDAEAKVYVRQSRLKVLKRFIDIREKGAADSGEIRDRISTRRARTAMRRMGGLGW